jgi:putative endopeptidase
MKSILDAACSRIQETEWLEEKTRGKAVEKVKKIKASIVRPGNWTPFTPVKLDSENLLWNIFQLGTLKLNTMLENIGKEHKYWDEGIYRVNAYYYNENNEIMVPYGTVYYPFYSVKESAAWNFGALGSILGHEICHAFDEDGKNYNGEGEKEKWWTRKDNLRYNHKSKELIHLYSKEEIDGTHLNGKKTLSENIADLGGLAIALEALQNYFIKENITEVDEQLKAYRIFFYSFAVSWRTKYRAEKLQRMIELDLHAPAEQRVNLVVCQFDEWYDAFGVKEGDEMFCKPKDRIRIF